MAPNGTKNDAIAYLSAGELTALYRTGSLSPVEATEALFARLDELQPKLNAFCVVDRDGALEAARASEGRWRAGTADVAGRRRAGDDQGSDADARGCQPARGSHLIENVPDTEDDLPAVARLKEAGAVILGKTTTPEFGWIAVGDSPLTGITRNPWNLARTPGGSSAGAAAACAAGIGVLNLGSDGAGSIRIPACFSGGVRDQADLWPGAGLSPVADGVAVASRAARAQRCRRRGDAHRAEPARPARPVFAAAARRRFPRRDRRRYQGLADRLQPRSRLRQGAARDRRRGRRRRQAIRGAGRACRGGRQDL